MDTIEIDAIFDLTDDYALCSAVFGRFAELNNKIDVEAYSEEERVVTLVWHASGIIGNGGFDYLFEGEFNGDPGFVHTAAAFKTIGALESHAAFHRALGVFGGRYPINREERITAFHNIPEQERTAMFRQFGDDEKNRHSCLARYIRERRDPFRQLLARSSGPTAALRRIFRRLLP